MNLILLYGPPAVGKLTVAKEIARLTGFKVFHNHLTVNLAAAIFPRSTPAYRQLVWDLRYAVFAEAARANIAGLIFTMVYRRDQEPYIARCVEIVERFGGNVCFVHLYCHAETVRQRVVREDRQQYGKITSVELLDELLSRWEPQALFEATTQWDSLSLDTDVWGPVEAAQQIMAHYRPQVQECKSLSAKVEPTTLAPRAIRGRSRGAGTAPSSPPHREGDMSWSVP